MLKTIDGKARIVTTEVVISDTVNDVRERINKGEAVAVALGPLVIVVLASIVAAMVVALYMPMFKTFDLVQ